LCHRVSCPKIAGSYVASNLIIGMDKVLIEDRDGPLKAYEDREATQCIVRSVPIMESEYTRSHFFTVLV
jgi:hypothetical protein